METIVTTLHALSTWELVAVICALIYLLLAVKESIWCWLFAASSTIIYTVLFWNVNLLMDSALNIYYLAMAGYGWYHWTHGDGGNNGSSSGSGSDSGLSLSSNAVDASTPASSDQSLKIRSLSGKQQLWIIAAIAVMTAVSGYFLSHYSSAVWPYVDSFTTWASVVTTYLVAQKYLQNWLYWIAIDSVCIPLYLERGMALTALLFFLYVIIVIFGYFRWRKQYMEQRFDERKQGPSVVSSVSRR